MSVKQPTTEHEAFFAEVCEVARKYSVEMPADELLAIASNFVGRLVAMQDQRKYTASELMEIVICNIQLGNKQMLDQLINVEPAGNA